MGLLNKKTPCSLCGGKVDIFLPVKIEGELVCDDCNGKIDMQKDKRDILTLAGAREYLEFFEANRELVSKFNATTQIDTGFFKSDMVVDCGNRLFCMKKDLSTIIFSGKSIQSFKISEDNNVIFEGTPNGFITKESKTIEKAEALEPQINRFQMQKQMEEENCRRERELERRLEANGATQAQINSVRRTSNSFGSSSINLTEPFKDFHIVIKMNHPYYSILSFDISGPTFSNYDPDLGDYLNKYNSAYESMSSLAESLAKIAFPEAPKRKEGSQPMQQNVYMQQPMMQNAYVQQPVVQSAPAMDPVEEIKKYKGLLEEGIISQEEFDAKKKQIMGI